MSTTQIPNTSIIEHPYTTPLNFNNNKENFAPGHLNDPRICYINSTEDLHVLHTSSGGTINRILRCVDKIEISAKYGMLIATQIFHPANVDKWHVSNGLMTNCIKPLGSYWLSKECEEQIVVKAGAISPRYNGRIYVAVFNKSDDRIVIPKNSAIAQIESKLYPYMSSAPQHHTLF